MERAGPSSLDLLLEAVSLLEVRLEGRGVPVRHSLQGRIERKHEVAEGAARAGLRLYMYVDRVRLSSA